MAGKVVIYTAKPCGLCERALEIALAAQDELGFELEVVDIGGDPELESRYREHLPVVEIDGERAFTHFVEPDALRERISHLAVLQAKPGEPLAES
jgi:glutaredoxin